MINLHALFIYFQKTLEAITLKCVKISLVGMTGQTSRVLYCNCNMHSAQLEIITHEIRSFDNLHI